MATHSHSNTTHLQPKLDLFCFPREQTQPLVCTGPREGQMLGVPEVWMDVLPRSGTLCGLILARTKSKFYHSIMGCCMSILTYAVVYNISKLIIGISGHMVTCVQDQEFCFYQTSMEHPVIKKKKKKHIILCSRWCGSP